MDRRNSGAGGKCSHFETTADAVEPKTQNPLPFPVAPTLFCMAGNGFEGIAFSAVVGLLDPLGMAPTPGGTCTTDVLYVCLRLKSE